MFINNSTKEILDGLREPTWKCDYSKEVQEVLDAACYCFPPRGKVIDMADAWNRLRKAVCALEEIKAKR